MSLEFKEVWSTLNAINVNDHVEKKGQFSYLAWTWGWATLMDHYPDATYDFREPVFFSDGSCEVWCDVTIEGHTRSMWLPVMDFNNKAMTKPTSRDISDTRMRCLIKTLAMFGLGHYIYAKESTPQDEKVVKTAKAKSEFTLAMFDDKKMDMVDMIKKGERTPKIIVANLERKHIVSSEIKTLIMGIK